MKWITSYRTVGADLLGMRAIITAAISGTSMIAMTMVAKSMFNTLSLQFH